MEELESLVNYCWPLHRTIGRYCSRHRSRHCIILVGTRGRVNCLSTSIQCIYAPHLQEQEQERSSYLPSRPSLVDGFAQGTIKQALCIWTALWAKQSHHHDVRVSSRAGPDPPLLDMLYAWAPPPADSCPSWS